MDGCRNKLLLFKLTQTQFSIQNSYNSYSKYMKMSIIFAIEILSSGVWIQSKEIKGSRIADFDCVLLLCYPGYKWSDIHHCFLSKPSRFFQCT